MDKLLESARRNPDAIAVAVLCLFGAVRQLPPIGDAAYQAIAPVGIHRILAESVAGAVNTVRARLSIPRCPFN